MDEVLNWYLGIAFFLAVNIPIGWGIWWLARKWLNAAQFKEFVRAWVFFMGLSVVLSVVISHGAIIVAGIIIGDVPAWMLAKVKRDDA